MKYFRSNCKSLQIKMSSIIVGQSYDLLLKMVVIGDTAVGKTNLLSRFERDEFSLESKPTIGVEFATKTLAIDGHKIKVQIWDTAGQQRFRAITHAYYKGAAGSLIVFDLSRRSTFDNITKWLKELKQNAEEDIVSILIGNKSDLTDKRCIKLEEIQKFTEQHNLAYLETSAKDNVNVMQAFHKVIQQIYENKIKKNMISAKSTSGRSRQQSIKKTQLSPKEGGIQLKRQTANEPAKKKCC